MTPERQAQVRQLFRRMVDAPPEVRQRYKREERGVVPAAAEPAATEPSLRYPALAFPLGTVHVE